MRSLIFTFFIQCFLFQSFAQDLLVDSWPKDSFAGVVVQGRAETLTEKEFSRLRELLQSVESEKDAGTYPFNQTTGPYITFRIARRNLSVFHSYRICGHTNGGLCLMKRGKGTGFEKVYRINKDLSAGLLKFFLNSSLSREFKDSLFREKPSETTDRDNGKAKN